ncbi:xylulokinase [Caldimonas brevitalea]|uniref:Xylulokinase n=1 Tax=Caldimonas brevitalea TaxID=413882 RepID=A0A0G3BQ49_9BURK|nr:FGGY family carbohydrate kinase [Caldimonas brevitalea]AKJ28685.1 xylulokinase [Caldimonas brevitalea]
MNEPLWLGLDLGTGSAKAAIVSPAGTVLAEASAGYEVLSRAPGWAETEPVSWWQAVCRCTRELPAPLRARVPSIGLSGQMHGVVLTAVDGQAVRPALLWPDQRAGAELGAYHDVHRERLANPLTPGMMGPLLLWLARHEPGALARARWALLPKDWLRWQMVGTAASDPSDVSGSLLSTPDGEWDMDLICDLGLGPHLFPPVRASADAAGTLRRDAADALGLPAGVTVATGAADTAAAAFGSGLVEPGMAQLSVGSGAQIIVMQRDCPAKTPQLNAYRAVVGAGGPGWYVMAAMQNAGTALEWVRALFDLSWEQFHEQAFGVDRRLSQALFLPYLNGERTPWMDAQARGAWVGLARSDDRPRLLHAALRGVAFALRAGLDVLRGGGHAVTALRLAGGGAAHPAWRQLLADVLGCPLWPSEVPNASARGAALLGALAAGLLDPAALPPVAALSGPVVQPAPDHQADHEADYARFRASYLALHPIR